MNSREQLHPGLPMTVSDAVRTRRACRSFTSEPVPETTLRELLELARFAPSGGNLQPWQVHVLMGESMQRFRSHMAPKVAAMPTGGKAEYHIYPPELDDPWRTRRFQIGEDLYATINVGRDDKPGRLRQFARNFDFFGAPAALFLFLDRRMGPPQWSDAGMFLQTLMLLARERGLDTCPQESWANWHGEVSAFLGAPAASMLFCGLAIGHADRAAPINALRSRREPVDGFATFHR